MATNGPTDYINVERDAYDWTSATKDLALVTRLTLTEASALTHQLAFTDLVPYDTVMRIADLINATTGEGIGRALRILFTGDARPMWEIATERRKAAEAGDHAT